MSTHKILAGKTIAVLAANGVEQAELESAVAALNEAGAIVTLIGLHPGRIRGMHLHQSASLVRVDKAIDDARAGDYDGLLIPGGCVSPDILRQSAQARALVQQFDQARKPIATLSQAPLLLVSAGLARNRTLTAWPGIRDDVVNAGATWLNQHVVRDCNLLSCRGAPDMAHFLRAMIPFYAGKQDATSTLLPAQSDPAQERPLELPDESLHWLGTPSLSAMLGLALLGVGVVATHRARHKHAGPAPDSEAPVAKLDNDATMRRAD